METSRRAKRMKRHHSRNKRAAPLNLVSLMDIFTILVFFLLVNSSDVEVLPSTKMISLPESVAEDKPRETVVVMVTDSDILVQGHKVISVNEALADDSPVLMPLKVALEQQATRILRKQGGVTNTGPEVTIMGDREISYRLLKKVMLSCTLAKYGKVSLAVIQKSTEGV